MALGRLFGRKKKKDEQPEEPTPEASAETAEASAQSIEQEQEAGQAVEPESENGPVPEQKPEASPEAIPEQPDPTPLPSKKKEGRFARLFKGLAKTRDNLLSMLPFGRKLDDEALEKIEETLISSDFGPATSMAIADELRQAFKDREFDQQEIVPFLKNSLVSRLGTNTGLNFATEGPTVVVVAGVNGTGKTTSIAKITNQLTQDGKKVLLAAADTFRAAAVEQLTIWSQRIGVDIVRGKEGCDPSSVVYDAIEQGVSGDYDVIIIDTAGRLHTEKNLMAQLSKMARVIEKKIPEGPHEVLQVLDATTGQNAIQQAAAFNKAMTVSGLVLTKLDGTARGGVIFPILDAVGLPVKYIGVGEGIDDLQVFDPVAFVDALFE